MTELFDDEEDEFVSKYPLKNCITVNDLIKLLQTFDPTLPVVGAYRGWIRENEYHNIHPFLSNLDEQNVDGDPEFYGSQECVVLRNE